MTAPDPNRARSAAFVLDQRPKAVCARCVATALGITVTAAENATVVIEDNPEFAREWTKCDACGKYGLTARAR
jgi:hypothetical protein